ncbi:hypothetical protein Dimus_036925, partial [Dionaea muscipula]
ASEGPSWFLNFRVEPRPRQLEQLHGLCSLIGDPPLLRPVDDEIRWCGGQQGAFVVNEVFGWLTGRSSVWDDGLKIV